MGWSWSAELVLLHQLWLATLPSGDQGTVWVGPSSSHSAERLCPVTRQEGEGQRGCLPVTQPGWALRENRSPCNPQHAGNCQGAVERKLAHRAAPVGWELGQTHLSSPLSPALFLISAQQSTLEERDPSPWFGVQQTWHLWERCSQIPDHTEHH